MQAIFFFLTFGFELNEKVVCNASHIYFYAMLTKYYECDKTDTFESI
jgi:hypothetical protein